MPRRINRRELVQLAAGTVVASGAPVRGRPRTVGDGDEIVIPDDGWRLWVDENAAWQNDTIHLPGEFDLAALPVNPPTGGWDVLSDGAGIAVTLPSTVEQHHWGRFGTRPYTLHEYAWAATDPVPKNGAYTGVSWWWRMIDVPAAFAGRRITLTIRGARMRAEVFLNGTLVGYSIMEELPFDCDLTHAARPGGHNVLAIRITNPGGRYDWIDGDTIAWGGVNVPRSHGFGGIDRGLTLRADPPGARIADVWVLNTPDIHSVHAYVRLEPAGPHRDLTLDLVHEASNHSVAASVRPLESNDPAVAKFVVVAKGAKTWSLSHPHLYRLRARLKTPSGESVRNVTFGFRWFAPDGLGTNAVFRLNGRRIRLYSAISWGYWGMNGLWPTSDLAAKEVLQAKRLGLNCLNFHRNVGKEDVFREQDRLGLLRIMEPGGGKFALGKLPDGTRVDAHSVVMERPTTDADKFAQRFMVAKCVAMVRAFRSHPSLIQYTLQNENGADLDNPDTVAILGAIRAEDASRTILLNDGMIAPPTSAAQAWYAPYDTHLHRSDRETWGGWWDDHQGAGDQWYDDFYKRPADFNYNRSITPQIVMFGEMEGCAVPDNHVRVLAEIQQRGGSSYDLADHREILAGYQAFLDRWKFRDAFPTAEALFAAIASRSYESWRQYIENARINDTADAAVISGWETTAIDNHSGLVDNLRNFHGDPAPLRASLMPVRPLAKQHNLVVTRGERAVFDLYLLDDTAHQTRHVLDFSVTDPLGHVTELGTFRAPLLRRDQFSTLLREAMRSPPLIVEGMHRFALAVRGLPQATHVCDIWVVDTKRAPVAGRTIRVAVDGVWPILHAQLADVSGIAVEAFAPGETYDAIISSGLTERSTPPQKLGGDAGLTLQRSTGSTPSPGELSPAIIDAVKAGTPLLLLPQEDGLADGVARQLAIEGAFAYSTQVGRLRAPWMGNWYFLRDHPLYDGMPFNQAMGLHFQAHGRQANGLIVDGANVDVCVGYSRDHDRRVGAGTFTTKLGNGKIVFQRVPDLCPPMQQRFLINALAWLCR